MPDWITPSRAANMLGVSVATVRSLADSGKLTMERTALGRLISFDSVESLKAERETA